MDIHGILVVSTHSGREAVCDENTSAVIHDGFITNISKGDIVRGPFETVEKAVAAAHAWAAELAKNETPVVAVPAALENAAAELSTWVPPVVTDANPAV